MIRILRLTAFLGIAALGFPVQRALASMSPPPPSGGDGAALPTLPISGRVFSDIYFPANNTDTSNYRQSSASLWLQGDPRLGDYGSARFILTGDEIQNNTVSAVGGTGSQFRVGLREGYASYVRSGWDFRFGQQIIPWGKSDAINPTDFLSAKDYTFFNPDEEVRRLGSVSMMLAWTPAQGNSPVTITFVGTPIFTGSKLLIPPSAVPAGITLTGGQQMPPQILGNTETALKISYAASRWDASVSVFRGFNHTPEFAVLSSTTNPATGLPASFNVGQTFHAIRAVGGDASLTWGKLILRGETSYTWTENDNGLNALIQPSHWDSVIGIERPINNDFRVQAQFVYRVYPLWSNPALAAGPDPLTTQVDQGIAAANAELLAYQDPNRPGATFRISYSNETNGLDAEIFLLGNFVGGDYLVRPKLSYHWTDALLTTLGLDWYGGPTNRPLGSMQVFNSVFAEAKYTF